MAKGIRRMVADEEIGLPDFLSFKNFAFSSSRREKSEIIAWCDKHDFSRPKITQSIVLSFRKAPMPRATISPGRYLSWRRCRGSIRMLASGKAHPPGFGLENNRNISLTKGCAKDIISSLGCNNPVKGSG
jgi:hypothetical protein